MKATIDVHGYVMDLTTWLPQGGRRVVGLIAYTRGLCVARPTKMGTCQSLNEWDEQWFGATRLN
jgi:hypothetical protein